MDYSTLFRSLSDDTQVWIYASESPLSEEKQAFFLEKMNRFFLEWVSHSDAVQGQVLFLHNRFLVIAGSVPGRPISGCGIDQMTDALQDISRKVSITWASPLSIFYFDPEGNLRMVSRPEFKTRVEAGQIDVDTIVFDASVNTLGNVRSGAFEKPAGYGWTRRYFKPERLVSWTQVPESTA